MTALRSFVIAGLCGIVIVLTGLILLDWRASPDIDVRFDPAMPIAVHIAGSVATPGTYMLPANARLNDAIVAAGGLRENADTAAINPAARIGDGERILIPALAGSSDSASMADKPASGLVNINTATTAELDTLPGIGPVLAGRIIEYRELHGRFSTIDQLLEVEGISRSTVDGLRDLVTTGG
jgi:competence protein ComEA